MSPSGQAAADRTQEAGGTIKLLHFSPDDVCVARRWCGVKWNLTADEVHLPAFVINMNYATKCIVALDDINHTVCV